MLYQEQHTLESTIPIHHVRHALMDNISLSQKKILSMKKGEIGSIPYLETTNLKCL